MKYVAIVIVLLSLPLFISLLKQYPHRRSLGFVALGFLFFCRDGIRLEAFLYGWPLWKGLTAGLAISPVDTLALALLATRDPRARFGRAPFWGLLALFMATMCLSVLMSAVPIASGFAVWMWLRILLLFAAISAELDRPDLRAGLLRGLALGLMLQAAYVIWQKLHGVVQATGTIVHQNTLGMMTEQGMIVITAAILAGSRDRLLKAGALAGLIIVVGGGSRGAMVLVAGGIMVLSLLSVVRRSTPTKLKMIGLGVLALAVVTPLGLMTIQERFRGASVITEETERAAFERAARAMANDHLFGVGANLYVSTANTAGYAQRAGVAWNYANRSAMVHNAYLLARAETGWLGQLAYMLLIFVPLWRGLRFAFRNRADPAGEIVLGSCVALGVLAVHNLYEFAGLTYPILALTVMNLAVVASVLRAPQRRSRTGPRVQQQFGSLAGGTTQPRPARPA